MRPSIGRPRIGLRRDATPYRLSFFRPLPRSIGGVQEFEFCREVTNRVVGKLKRGQIALQQDVNSEHFSKGCVPDRNGISKRGE